jgi:hypothetical protein
VLNIPKQAKEMFARHIQHARIEAPAVANARVQTASISYRRSYPKKEAAGSSSNNNSSSGSGSGSGSKEVKSSRATGQAAPRTAQSTKNPGTQKTQVAKRKAEAGKASAPEVQTGSILGGGKTSLAAKNFRAAAQDKTGKKGAPAAAKKSNKKEPKKKPANQSSLKEKKTKATAKGAAPPTASKSAASTQKPTTRKKTPSVRTAAGPRPGSS